MNLLNVFIQTLGGLGLFILGMKMMTDGLQMSAGDRIKKILSAVSSNRIVGCGTGAFVTAMVQSSSATTVMLISFVGAGMMTLQQAIGVILGANVGTTITAQMIAFNLTSVALPAIAIGVGLKFFSKNRRQRYIGEVILGFGLLFFGMTVMKQGLAPIKGDPQFIEFFTKFNAGSLTGILFCVATGAVLTFMIQSSSATVGLTMTLATQGLLDFPAAMALVLGENIGTTITAQLATIGSKNVNTHRAARAHTLFNVIGVVIMIAIFPFFIQLIEIVSVALGADPLNQLTNNEVVNVSRYIANGHSVFNILSACIFLIFLPWLIKAAVFISPKEDKENDELRLPNFDHRFLDTPIAALTKARSEIIKMSDVAMKMLKNTIEAFEKSDSKKLNKWRRYEDHLDLVQREITSYLTRIYQSDLNQSEAREISSMMRMTNNIERIGDSIENIALMIEDVIENKTGFSSQAIFDIKKISNQVADFIALVQEGIKSEPAQFMKQAQILEDNIDFMREEMRQDHIERLRSGTCTNEPGLMFSDMLSNFEKMGDYCYNIAQAVARIK